MLRPSAVDRAPGLLGESALRGRGRRASQKHTGRPLPPPDLDGTRFRLARGCGDRSRERSSGLSEWIRKEDLDVRSLLIVKDGKLVFERYSSGLTRDDNYELYSITKGVTSLAARAF